MDAGPHIRDQQHFRDARTGMFQRQGVARNADHFSVQRAHGHFIALLDITLQPVERHYERRRIKTLFLQPVTGLNRLLGILADRGYGAAPPPNSLGRNVERELVMLAAATHPHIVQLKDHGMSPDYVANTGSYYTVETHIMYLDEVLVNSPMYSTTQVLRVSEKTLHLFHRLHAGEDDRVLSVAEQFYLHVGPDGRVCAADPELLARANAFADAHASLPWPEQAGRQVGQRK